MKKYALASLLFIFVGESALVSANAKLRPFTKNSLEQIILAQSKQAFIMILWSIDCPSCMKELDNIQAVQAQFSNINIVLISTDAPEYRSSVIQTLSHYQLEGIDSWIFADALPERLRYIIDPNWYGELPRAYFYDSAHQRKAHSGILTKTKLEQWLTKHQPK